MSSKLHCISYDAVDAKMCKRWNQKERNHEFLAEIGTSQIAQWKREYVMSDTTHGNSSSLRRGLLGRFEYRTLCRIRVPITDPSAPE